MYLFTALVYGVILVAGVVVGVLSHVKPVDLAPIGKLLDRLLDSRAIRVTLVVFWWWLGWHFLVVQTVDPPAVTP